jgi:1,2-diacylglycerol 3-alpha-glucosyltransferase
VLGRFEMRVAIFTDSWFPRIDGLTTSVQAFKAQLERRGHTFHVFAPGPRWERTHEVTRYKGVPFWAYPDFHVSLRPGRHDTARILREEGFDLVHIQSPFMVGLWGLLGAREAGLPAITSYHTYLPDLVPYVVPPGLRRVARVAVWRSTASFFARCNAVLAPSPSCAAELLRHIPPEKVPNLKVQPNGVDVERFHPRWRSPTVRAALAPEGRKVLLSVGRLAREKDLPFVLDAFLRARQSDPDLLLCIGGKGPDFPRIRRRAARLGLDPHVRYLGFVPDEELGALYASADAFVSASQFETQGMTAVEAMASGLPVAAARSRGLADYVVDGRTGVQFTPGDVAAAAEAILACVSDGGRMRRAAREHAETLSLEACTDRLERIYQEAVAAGPRGEVPPSTSSR